MLTLRPYLNVETDGEGRRVYPERDMGRVYLEEIVPLWANLERHLGVEVVTDSGEVLCTF